MIEDHEHAWWRYVHKSKNCDECNRLHTIERRKLRWKKYYKLLEEGWYKWVNDRRICTHPGVKHGTVTGYNYWWCQCGLCTEAQRMRKYANKTKTS